MAGEDSPPLVRTRHGEVSTLAFDRIARAAEERSVQRAGAIAAADRSGEVDGPLPQRRLSSTGRAVEIADPHLARLSGEVPAVAVGAGRDIEIGATGDVADGVTRIGI
jgi:hypothetical protein